MDRATSKPPAKPTSTSSSKPVEAKPDDKSSQRLSDIEPLRKPALGSNPINLLPTVSGQHLRPAPAELQAIPRLFDHMGPDSTSRHERPSAELRAQLDVVLRHSDPGSESGSESDPGSESGSDSGSGSDPGSESGSDSGSVSDSVLEARREAPTLELPALPPPPLPAPKLSASGALHPGEADLYDIQGLVYHSWVDHPFAAYQFASFGDPAAARAWLAALQPRITASLGYHGRKGRLQVALSPRGLLRLGVPDHVVAQLPNEVRAGMAARAHVLNDTPAEWSLGQRDELDVMVMMFARDAEARAAMVEEQRAALTAAGATLPDVELSVPLPEQREHFGFVDGISQPFIHGLYPAPRNGREVVSAGEVVLGYPNQYNRLPHSPRWDALDLGRNGSYLVFRKLEQHVESFWGHLTETARAMEPDGDEAKVAERADFLAAKMMGRWPSGASMMRAPDRDDPAHAKPDVVNDISYRADPEGLRCPFSSHVRRANPRDAHNGASEADSRKVIARHRILRRGRSWGPSLPAEQARRGQGDQQARGLYFICLQTSIARGFEFIQQTWLNNRGFSRLSGEADPLTSAGCPFTIPAEPVRLRLPPSPRFVTPRGGGYFFLPSLTALARIAAGP